MNETNVLRLTTRTIDQKAVRIDGQEFSLKTVDDLGVLDVLWFQRNQARVAQLESLEEPSDEETAEYSRLMKGLVKRILSAPADVLDSMNDMQLAAVLRFFVQPAKPVEPEQGTKKAPRRKSAAAAV